MSDFFIFIFYFFIVSIWKSRGLRKFTLPLKGQVKLSTQHHTKHYADTARPNPMHVFIEA